MDNIIQAIDTPITGLDLLIVLVVYITFKGVVRGIVAIQDLIDKLDEEKRREEYRNRKWK